MGKRAAVWGLGFVAAGTLVVTGVLGAAWSMNARIGAASALFSMGLLFLGIAFLPWILRMTTRPEDYKGGCPVGVKCSCGAFTFKPKTRCGACGKPLDPAAPTTAGP